MKTNDETICNLFERREALFQRRKKYRKVMSACLIVAFFLTAPIIYSKYLDKHIAKLKMSAQETRIKDVYAGVNDGHSVSNGDQKDDTYKNNTKISINELDLVPTCFMSQYISTYFEPMTVEEVLSHFRLQLDIEGLFDDYCLQKDEKEHGFYVKEDGTVLEQDHFFYSNEDNSKILSIMLQSTNVADVYQLTNCYKEPICSYVCGKEVYIFHWQDNEDEELFCEFVFRDNVGISIHMRNIGTSELAKLIEYFVIQEPVYFEARIIP